MAVTEGFRLLDIDLSSRRVNSRECAASTIAKYLGGQGLAISILYEEIEPDVDAMAPDNIIVIAPGLLTGTEAPASARTEVLTKSPLTGNLGRGNFGGSWGTALRRAGYLGLIVRGVSVEPVFLRIDDSGPLLEGCAHLWGTDAWETTDCFRREYGDDISVLAIGPAGERCVRFACPVVDYHHAPARSHAGCVMGRKRLKAIVIMKGRRALRPASPRAFRATVSEALERVRRHPNWSEDNSTPIHNMLAVRNSARAGQLGCRNYQTTSLPQECEIWRVPESVGSHLNRGADFCEGCAVGKGIGCNTTARIESGEYTGTAISPANYLLTIWMPQAGLSTYPGSWKAREICQRLGMDQLTPIPLAMEWFQKGVITRNDTDGIELAWGNEGAVHEMLRRIAYREGFGDILAEGSERAARAVGKGAEESLVLLKGMPILGRDPRVGSLTKALGALVGSRGGDDLSSTHAMSDGFPGWARKIGWTREAYLEWWTEWLDMPQALVAEVYGVPPLADSLDASNPRGKAALVCWQAQLVSVIDSLGVCMFPVNNLAAWGPTLLSGLTSSYLGYEISPHDLMSIGHRVQTLMRAYSWRQGYRRGHDIWPNRFYDTPLPDGPFKGATADRELTNALVDGFHRKMRWDEASGRPTRGTLRELDLGSVADDLWES